MKINISGMSKAEILVALYKNAKNSKYTRQVIGVQMCPDPHVLGMLSSIYQPRIDAEIAKLKDLTIEEATELLASSSLGLIDYIGPVLIKIYFSSDVIDTSKYDQAHFDSGKTKRAEEVIEQLQGKTLLANSFNQMGSSSVGLFAAPKTQISMAPKISSSGASRDLDKFISTENAVRSLLNKDCTLFNSEYLGISIEMPETASELDVAEYADLLRDCGVEVKIKPPVKVIATLTFPAKIEINNETLESFAEKIAFLQSPASETSSSVSLG